MTPLTDEERDQYRLGSLKYTTPNVDSHGGTIEAFGTIPAYGQPIYALVLGGRGGGPLVHLTRRGLEAVVAACEQVLAAPLDTVIIVPVEPGDRDLSAEDRDRRAADRLANPPPPPCPHLTRVLWPVLTLLSKPGFHVGFFVCDQCATINPNVELEEGPIYQCGTCGTYGIGPDGRRCESCNRFAAKDDDAPHGVCPACMEAPVQPIAVLQCTACGDVIPAPPEEGTDGDH